MISSQNRITSRHFYKQVLSHETKNVGVWQTTNPHTMHTGQWYPERIMTGPTGICRPVKTYKEMVWWSLELYLFLWTNRDWSSIVNLRDPGNKNWTCFRMSWCQKYVIYSTLIKHLLYFYTLKDKSKVFTVLNANMPLYFLGELTFCGLFSL